MRIIVLPSPLSHGSNTVSFASASGRAAARPSRRRRTRAGKIGRRRSTPFS
jgi:hypothetical protein